MQKQNEINQSTIEGRQHLSHNEWTETVAETYNQSSNLAMHVKELYRVLKILELTMRSGTFHQFFF